MGTLFPEGGPLGTGTHCRKKASLKKSLVEEIAKHQARASSADPGSLGIGAQKLTMTRGDTLPPVPDAPVWLSFHPRKWIGCAGMKAIAVLIAVPGLSLVFPFNRSQPGLPPCRKPIPRSCRLNQPRRPRSSPVI